MHPQRTANERFKSGFGTTFWIALIGATALHVLVLLGSPTFAVAMADGTEPPPLTVVPDAPPLPPPPQDIAPPVIPVVSDVAPPEATIPVNIPDAGSRVALEPPRAGAGSDAAAGRRWTVFEVAPRLRNPAEVEALLRRVYPGALREAGIGGSVRVWFHIDERGRVVETELNGSSGYDAFDRAALEVADRMEFSPAENLGRPVPVWVSLEVRFEVR